MAGTTGLEPATSAVTGQRSNQLSYVPTSLFRHLDICHIESSGSQSSLASTISLLWTEFGLWSTSWKHHGGHQNQHRNDKIKSTRRDRVLGSMYSGHSSKRFAVHSIRQRSPRFVLNSATSHFQKRVPNGRRPPLQLRIGNISGFLVFSPLVPICCKDANPGGDLSASRSKPDSLR